MPKRVGMRRCARRDRRAHIVARVAEHARSRGDACELGTPHGSCSIGEGESRRAEERREHARELKLETVK